jgi:hypothetical protein
MAGIAILGACSASMAKPLLAQTQTTSQPLVVTAGITVAAPPVSWQTIAGTTVTLRFTALPSATGTATVTATSSGYAPEFVLRAPSGGTMVLTGATVQGAAIAALTRVDLADRDGKAVITCFTVVAPGGVIPVPPSCGQPAAEIAIGVAVPARGMLGPAAVATAEAQNRRPIALPNTGGVGLLAAPPSRDAGLSSTSLAEAAEQAPH